MATPERKSSATRDMRAVGMSIGEVNTRNLAERRHKKGECPTCGNKTHKIGLFGKRTALTVEGSCLYGRCLLCYPVEGYSRRPPKAGPLSGLGPPVLEHANHMNHINNNVAAGPLVVASIDQMVGSPRVPENFVIETEDHIPDDGTMVSGITMDHRLIVGARNWNGEIIDDELYEEDNDSFDGGVEGQVGQRGGWPGRPEPSVGGIDDDAMRAPERRRPSSETDPDDAFGAPSGPPKRYASHQESIMDQIGFDISQPNNRKGRTSLLRRHQPPAVIDENESFSVSKNASRQRQSVSPPTSRGTGSVTTGSLRNRSPEPPEIRFTAPRYPHESEDRGKSPRNEEKYELDNREPRLWDVPPKEFAVNFNDDVGPSEFPPNDLEFEREPLRPAGRALQFNRLSGDPTRSVWTGKVDSSEAPPLISRRGMPDDDYAEGLGRTRPSANVIRKPSTKFDAPKDAGANIDDIEEIIANLDQSDRVRGFQSLAELIMACGQEAKIKIRASNGVQILVESMWTDMTDASVMEAACELMFALTASSDGNPHSDVLVGDSAEGAVDALLITMQTHLSVESIQQNGCATLHCLASASSTNEGVPDGTLSGAVFTVVNAMDMHRNSQEVQEWGIRALYSQCMHSRHAESNKKNLAQSGHDGGAGMDVIRLAMEIAKSDLVTNELACRLYWSLASNEDVARRLMETPAAAISVVDAIERFHKRPEAASLVEAAYGALANMARVCQDQQIFRDIGMIARAVQSIQSFHYDEALYVEACALLGVLANDRQNFPQFEDLEAVTVLSKLMHHYNHNATLQEEALYALVCLTNGSESSKSALASEASIGSVVRVMRDRNATPAIQELACTLISSLCVLENAAEIAVTNGAIDCILAVLKEHPNERRIQEAAFCALRNITSHGTGVDVFLKPNTAKILLSAMNDSKDSVTAQLNACCMLWNVCAKATKDPSSLVDAGAIMLIVRAMQSHMESGEMLEMACGALWCLIDQSDSRKKELLGCGAIDAVTCALVMHPKEAATLEKACGLLANVCTQVHMAEAIADSQGISMIIEAITNNATSMKLLELATLVLRNMVLTNAEFAGEASNGISAVINCMKENPDAVGFQREACNALWAFAAQSEDCKSKILALDGVTVLMGALEHNSCVGDVQDAARGAINQLALSRS